MFESGVRTQNKVILFLSNFYENIINSCVVAGFRAVIHDEGSSFTISEFLIGTCPTSNVLACIPSADDPIENGASSMKTSAMAGYYLIPLALLFT